MMPIKLWLHIILSTLYIISDREYQNRIWVQGIDENVVDSYIETMCNLFDEGDVRNFIDNHTKEAGLTYKQAIELKRIVDIIDQYDGTKLTPADMLQDPKWIEITNKTKKVLKVLPVDNYGWKQGL